MEVMEMEEDFTLGYLESSTGRQEDPRDKT
jgi:hypothetical protein